MNSYFDKQKQEKERRPITKQKENVMNDNFGKKMIDKLFRKVDDCVWDLMTGKIGVKVADNIVMLEGEGDDAQIVENPFAEFSCPLPAFAQNTPVDQIKIGDLIYSAKKVMGWVVKVPDTTKGEKAFRLLKPDGTRGEWRPPKVQSLGLDVGGAMVLRSLINTVPGGNLEGLQGTLLPLMMMGGNSFGDMESMLPLLLMSQNGALGGNNMLQTMLLMKMMDKSSKTGTGFFD